MEIEDIEEIENMANYVDLTNALLESIIAYCDEFEDETARKISAFIKRGQKCLDKKENDK